MKYQGCDICGGLGHGARACGLRSYNRLQTERALLAGRAQPEEVRDWLEEPSDSEPRSLVKVTRYA